MAVPNDEDEKRTAKRSSLPAQTAGAYWHQNDDECEETTLSLVNNEDYPAASNDTCPSPADQQNGRQCRSRIARSKSRSRWIIVASLILISIAWVSESHSHGASRVKAIFSDKQECQDPYAMPGYLLHDDKARIARWIPYTQSLLNSNATPASIPPSRDETAVESAILALAPPSYAEQLKNRRSTDGTALELMRDKTILLLGCSLDRYFMESFCNSYGAEMLSVKDGWQHTFSCTIPGINIHLHLWFTYGALLDQTLPSVRKETWKFEDRVREYWLAQAAAANSTIEPDMIIWASGTWDVLGLRRKYANEQENWTEQAMSFQEIVWHQSRLHQMIDFLRKQWPDIPILYRPPTYLYKKDIPSHNAFLQGVKIEDIDQINEAIYQISQSAEAVMREANMPIFRWGEKLIGNNQFRDTMHFKVDSYPQWLYAEMMLYYLHYYSMPKPSHCFGSGPGSS